MINANLKKGVHDFNIIYKKYTEAVVEFEEEKAKFKAVFDNSPYSIAFNELDGSYIDVNNAFLTQWGVTLEQVVSVSEANYVFLGDEDKQRFYETLERDGRVTNMQTHIVRPDGSTSCVLFSSVLVTVFGKTVILSTAVDVTSIKEAEEKIKSWELKFDLTTAAANLAFYEYDVKNDSINWNGRLLEKLGYDSESMSGSMSVWSALLHPEDAEKTISLLEESLSRKTRYVVEYRIRCKNGSYSDIFEYGKFFGGNSGSPLRMLGIIQDITEIKRTKEALLEIEKRYQTIFNNAPVGIFRTSYSGRFLEANPAVARMLGFKDRNELFSIVKNFEATIYPHVDIRRSLLEALIASPAGVRRSVEFKRKDGSPFYAVVNVSLQFNELGQPAWLDGTIEDITLCKEAEDKLRQSEEKFASIFRIFPDGLVLFDLCSERIQDVNDAFLSMFDFSKNDVIDKNIVKLNIFNYFNFTRCLSKLNNNKKIKNIELVARRRNGEEFPCVISFQIIEINKSQAVFCTIRDIYEAKIMQNCMIEIEKMRILGGLSAGIAHEINNPLSVIVQASQNALNRLDMSIKSNADMANCLELDLYNLDKFFKDRNILLYLQSIKKSGERVASIVSNMRSFSRPDEKSFSFHDINAIVYSSIELASKDFGLKKYHGFQMLNISIICDPGVPPVPCLRIQIEQVLLNLMRNAVQAMSKCGTVNPALTLRTRKNHDWVKIEVEDNGPGIPEDDLGRIFKPFFTTKMDKDGTGLGLSVSYFIIANNHHGHLTATSREGRGSKFIISLPLRQNA